MAVNVSELMEAANAPAVQNENFYAERNDAFAQIAVEAIRNTPETLIKAQNKELAVVQQRNNLALDVILDAQNKDQQSYAEYLSEVEPRKQDYEMLRERRINNLTTIRENAEDDEQNNFWRNPIKTIVGSFRDSRIREQNNALIEEMNAINQGVAGATKEYIAKHEHNKQQLEFNLNTKVQLNTANALAAAKQEQQAAGLRYQDTQDDIAKLTTATSGISAAPIERDGSGRAKTTPTKQELAFYRSQKTGVAYNPLVSDDDYKTLLRSYNSEDDAVQNANAQAFVRYDDYIQFNKGSTETPVSFVQREITTTPNGTYGRALDQLNGGRYAELANIGLEIQVQKVADSLNQGAIAGLTPQQLANPMLMKQLEAAKGIADQTAQKLAVQNALATSFSETVDTGVDYIKGDMAAAVSTRRINEAAAYADPARVSSILNNADELLAQIPQKYLMDRDLTQVQAEADVVSRVTGMRGGDTQAHKFLEANDFLKRQGMKDEAERVAVLRKWLQSGLNRNYMMQGAYANTVGSAQIAVANKGEEFIVPVMTRPVKAATSVFGTATPDMPSFDLGSPVGMALYLKAIESGSAYYETQRKLQNAKDTAAFLGKSALMLNPLTPQE